MRNSRRWAGLLLVACAAAVALAPAASQNQQPPRFRSRADAVLVDVQVKSRGKPVAGLTAADFELRDSGVRQTIQAIAMQDVPISLLLVLDTSSSVEGDALEHLKGAALAAIATLGPDDQAAVIAFSQRVTLRSTWTSDRAALDTAIAGLQAHGWTALYEAIIAAMSLREQAAGRTLMLIFTDGVDTASALDPPSVIGAAQRSDLVITAVSAAARSTVSSGQEARSAFGSAAALRRWFSLEPTLFPYAFLETLAEETGGDLVHVEASRDLSQIFERIVADFRTGYLLTYVPQGVSDSGWHPIQVRLTRRAGAVSARRGYWR